MVLLGHKLISNVLKSLCPGPSRRMLQKDVLKRMARGRDVLGFDSDESRYKKLSEALSLCSIKCPKVTQLKERSVELYYTMV